VQCLSFTSDHCLNSTQNIRVATCESSVIKQNQVRTVTYDIFHRIRRSSHHRHHTPTPIGCSDCFYTETGILRTVPHLNEYTGKLNTAIILYSAWLPQFPRVRTNNLDQTSTGSAKHRY